MLAALPAPAVVAVSFEATRAAGLERLAAFVPHAGRNYRDQRNRDLGPGAHHHVSRLSPYLRHRLLAETEVLGSVLERHSRSAAEKFVQEVFWRAYFKGWLQQHPQAWVGYVVSRDRALAACAADEAKALAWEDALAGRTGIEPFDAWSRELVETGYLHNHARMWFASIWIFTLELPWALGADFFLRHLLDGDPASNTLSWRWVAGLHTRGKTYLARPGNIERYAGERFFADGPPAGIDRLAKEAPPLDEPPLPRQPLSWPDGGGEYAETTGLLLTEEDLWPEAPALPSAWAVLAPQPRSPLPPGSRAAAFSDAALADAAARSETRFPEARPGGVLNRDQVVHWARQAGLRRLLLPLVPVGPVADALAELPEELADAGISLEYFARDYDRLTWPHAGKGYFALKKRIPELLDALGV